MDLAHSTLSPTTLVGVVTFSVMAPLVLLEWTTGKYRDGRKTRADWQMFGLSIGGIALLERPIMLAVVHLLADRLVPEPPRALLALEQTHLVASIVTFVALEELLHGWAHHFTHGRAPRNPLLAKVHAFYREAHRGHHLLGGEDGRGEVNATHSAVAGWGWFLFLPNYWFGMLLLAFGFVDTWFWGTLIKTLWGMHVHSAFQYDLYLLNHPNRVVRSLMYALCHVLTFPNQHHHHHGRGKNSVKNMQNFLAIYDWLLWKTLVIERERPAAYGWKQRGRERGALYRYFNRPLATKPRRDAAIGT